MRLQVFRATFQRTGRVRGFTLAEVVIALAILVMVFCGIILAYTQAAYRAEWTGYSLAAESLAMKQLEQARSARWDPAAIPPLCEIFSLNVQGSNFNSGTQTFTGYSWTNLDLPSNGTNIMRATNYVTVKPVATGSSASNLMVRVDTVWSFRWRTQTKLFTNTIATYLAPDNKDPSDLFGN